MVPATTLTTIATVSEPHALPVSEVLARLDVAPATGLDNDEVERRTKAYGPNAIMSRRKASTLALLATSFKARWSICCRPPPRSRFILANGKKAWRSSLCSRSIP